MRISTVAFGGLLAVSAGAFAAVPGEVPQLDWCAGTKDCLSWTAAAGATSYTVYRGNGASLPRLVTGETDGCWVRRFATTTTGALLDERPLPSDGLEWYLVVGRNSDGEGSAGVGSAGLRQLDAWGSCCQQKVFADTFSLPNGSAWSSEWSELAATAESFTIASGRGRWRPWYSRYSLARLGASLGIPGDPGAPGERDVEVTFTIEFDDVNNQGIGFYLRQNGGFCLREPDWTVDKVAPCATSFNGSGYAVFIHGNFLSPPGAGFDLWAERDGDEQRLCPGGVCGVPFALQNGVRYRVRFRVLQTAATTTTLQAKIWTEGSPEPDAWMHAATDSTAALQNAFGAIGIDSWTLGADNTPPFCEIAPTPFTYIDDIEVRRACNPFLTAGAPALLDNGFSFSEGPVWRDGELFFTDIDASTIYRTVPPNPAVVHRSPSSEANGLATDRNRDLLACENITRRVSRQNAAGTVSTVVDAYQGAALNSPNDLTVRADGTLYFTDADYGLSGPRELAFNGLFQLAPSGTLTAAWQGIPPSTTPPGDEPNGVSLSPDEARLFVTNTSRHELDVWTVAADGSLGNRRNLAGNATLSTPDGICVDLAGNVYVTNWGNPDPPNVTIFAPDGLWLGAITMPEQPTNCAFGGSDGRTLFVTAHTGVYSISMPIPGVPRWP